MRTLLLLLACIAFPLINYAQTNFENGYFIDNNGNKSEVLIKNLDWRNNPESFEYKVSEQSEVKILNLQNTQEVGIYEKVKYTRHEVDIENSLKTGLNNLQTDRYPEFNKETVFLKSLVEGNADLLLYRQSNSVQYFYSVNKSNTKPLVYKKHLIANDNAGFQNYKIGENNTYKQTLLNNLKCEEISLRDVERLNYSDNPLVDFFVKYNECTGSSFVNFKPKQTKLLFNLSAKAGVNFSSLELKHYSHSRFDIDFGSQTNFQFGIEAEVLLPFNNHKWAIIFEPTYQYFKAETTIYISDRPNSDRHTEIDYRSIDFPLGIRHYFYLNDTSKFFINGAVVLTIDMDSKMLREYSSPTGVTPTESNLVFGVGYSYNRISTEIRYSTNRDIFGKSGYWTSKYSTTSLILGYRIF